MIGKSESLEGEFELEPRSRNPIIKKIKKTITPINNKNTAINTRTVLSKLNPQTISNKTEVLDVYSLLIIVLLYNI